MKSSTSIPVYFLNGIGIRQNRCMERADQQEKHVQLCLNPLIAVLVFLMLFDEVTVRKPFPQPLMCCTVVKSKYIFVIQNVKIFS